MQAGFSTQNQLATAVGTGFWAISASSQWTRPLLCISRRLKYAHVLAASLIPILCWATAAQSQGHDMESSLQVLSSSHTFLFDSLKVLLLPALAGRLSSVHSGSSKPAQPSTEAQLQAPHRAFVTL